MKRVLLLFVFAHCAAFSQSVQLVNAFPNLTFTQPVLVTHANDGSNRVFVVQQNGLIRVFPNDSTATAAPTFLNLSARISTGSERGLLGLAFHPNYATNGYFFVNYTQVNTGRTIVARYSVDPLNPNQGDFNSELILLNIYQPYTNHNGGMVFFGLDGYLYISMGDGGSAGDPSNRAQNVDSLLGKILRIDVDNPAGGLNYGIPPDNPLVGLPGRDEIYAWGLRNPWRMSQDPVSGEIWVADVGQGAWEEVDSLGKGLNYGWRCYEGPNPYNTTGCGPSSQYTFPKKYYSRSSPHCSVTGGYIYRGSRRPELTGRYVYGDYCSGYIWKFLFQNGQLTEDELLVDAPFSISSFGVDQAGELYVCNYAGTIWRFAGNPVHATTSQVLPVNGSRNNSIPATLLWRSANGATDYWLEIASDAGFSSTVVSDSTLADTSFVFASAFEGTRYYWRIRVKNASGWGNPSSVWNFTIASVPGQIDLLEPAHGANIPSRFVTLRWHSNTDATSYWLEMGYDSTFASVERVDTALTDTLLALSDATRDTTYYWRIRGRSPVGNGPFSSRIFSTYSLPAPPTLISPPDSSTIILATSIDFLWGVSENAADYWLEVALDQNFTNVVVRDSVLVDTARSVGGLDRPQRYFWRVRGRNQYGYGLFSNPWTFFYDHDLSVGDDEGIPARFVLDQNFPNPFNPSTEIRYGIPQRAPVRLTVVNLLGQEVTMWDQGVQQAGWYSVRLNAAALPSGVYFCRLDAGDFRTVRKMMLMK
jgi:glucose/arabinose dehydrogenase